MVFVCVCGGGGGGEGERSNVWVFEDQITVFASQT